MATFDQHSQQASAVAGIRELQQRFARAGYGPLLLARQRSKPSQLSSMGWLQQRAHTDTCSISSSMPARLLSRRSVDARYTMPKLIRPNSDPGKHTSLPSTAPTKPGLPTLTPSHPLCSQEGVPGAPPASLGPGAAHVTRPAAAAVPKLRLGLQPQEPRQPLQQPHQSSPIRPSSHTSVDSRTPRLHMAARAGALRPKKPRVPSQAPARKVHRKTRGANKPCAPPSTIRSPRALSEADIAEAVQAARRRVRQQAIVLETEPHAPDEHDTSTSPRYSTQELREAEERLHLRAAAVLAAQAKAAAAAELQAQQLQARLQQIAHEARAVTPAPSSPDPMHVIAPRASVPHETPAAVAELASDATAAAGKGASTPPRVTDLGPDLPPGAMVAPWSVHGSAFTSPIRTQAPSAARVEPLSPVSSDGDQRTPPESPRGVRRNRKHPHRRPRPMSPIRPASPVAAVDEASIAKARLAAARRVAQRRRQDAMQDPPESPNAPYEGVASTVNQSNAAEVAVAARRAAAARVAARAAAEAAAPKALSRRELEAIQAEARHEQQRRRMYALNALCRSFTDAQFRRFDEQLAEARSRLREEARSGKGIQ